MNDLPPADRLLLQRVRPAGWQNPRPRDRYDLVVVGGGTGGLVSAAIGSALGARVALIERRRLGGDCLNFGCVPSKAVLAAARSWAAARESRLRFGGPAVSGPGDFAEVMRRMRGIRSAIAEHDSAARFRDLGVDVFLGEGRFETPSSILVDGQTRLQFRRAVVATGTRPRLPSIPGLEEADVLTNETIFDLDRLPDRLLVLGSGPIGCELAQAFARFGSRVTLLDRHPRVLHREEPDASEVVGEALRRDGVEFIGPVEIRAVHSSPEGRRLVYERDGMPADVEGDALLIAAGRVPNVDLGLDLAKVGYDDRGVKVDDRLGTSNRRIYAVGDVASTYKFTHAADAQARLAVRNALFPGSRRASELVIPWATYTSPALARVGLTPSEARDRGMDIDSITVPLTDVDRARLDGEAEGFVRIHLRRGTDEIVGATIVAAGAGELISQVAQVMSHNVGLKKLGNVVFPYPTVAEALRKAADAHRRADLTPMAERLLGVFLEVWRLLN